jgi:quercetin dioxygenase-like cupin family protein
MTPPTPRAYPAGTGETLHVLGETLTLRGPVAGTDLTLVDVTIPPGSGTPAHSHASPETFRVLDGAPVFLLGTVETPAAPGDLIHIPPGAVHAYRNPGPTPARVTAILDDSLIAFFRDLATPTPLQGPPDAAILARVGAAAARHRITILPPG